MSNSYSWISFNNLQGICASYCTIKSAYDDFENFTKEKDKIYTELQQPYMKNELYELNNRNEKIQIHSEDSYIYEMPPEYTNMHIVYISHQYDSVLDEYCTQVLIDERLLYHYTGQSYEDEEDCENEEDYEDEEYYEVIETDNDLYKPMSWD